MQSLESLNMSITALKSLLSDYALRANQAEAITGRLLGEKLDDQQFRSLVIAMNEQMTVRGTERAVHQQALIQATVLSLEAALRDSGDSLKAQVQEVTKQLTMSQSHMNPSARPNPASTVNSNTQSE